MSRQNTQGSNMMQAQHAKPKEWSFVATDLNDLFDLIKVFENPKELGLYFKSQEIGARMRNRDGKMEYQRQQ